MPQDEIRSKILSFAAHIGNNSTPAETTAQRRNWIRSDGSVTEDGTALVDALDDQSATRTVFRGNL